MFEKARIRNLRQQFENHLLDLKDLKRGRNCVVLWGVSDKPVIQCVFVMVQEICGTTARFYSHFISGS